MATDSSIGRSKTIASALNFVSFLVINLTERELADIKQILLIEKKVFVDAALGKGLSNRIAAISKQFLYPMEFSVGKLEDLKKIPVEASVLYSKFQKTPDKGAAKTLISWEVVRPDSIRVLLNKRLFGYKHHGVFYEGLMQKYSGEKLGKGCISVPSEFAASFVSVFKEMKIEITIKEVLEVG